MAKCWPTRKVHVAKQLVLVLFNSRQIYRQLGRDASCRYLCNASSIMSMEARLYTAQKIKRKDHSCISYAFVLGKIDDSIFSSSLGKQKQALSTNRGVSTPTKTDAILSSEGDSLPDTIRPSVDKDARPHGKQEESLLQDVRDREEQVSNQIQLILEMETKGLSTEAYKTSFLELHAARGEPECFHRYGSIQSIIEHEVWRQLLLQAYAHSDDHDAISTMQHLQQRGVEADRQLTHDCIRTFVVAGRGVEASQLLLLLLSHEKKPWTGARKLYTMVIACLCKSDHPDVAIELVHSFREYGVSINNHTFRMIMDTLASQGAYQNAGKFFNDMVGAGLVPHRGIYRAYLDAYLAAGKVYEAANFLDIMARSQVIDDWGQAKVEMYNRVFRGILAHDSVKSSTKYAEEIPGFRFYMDHHSCKEVVRLYKKGQLSDGDVFELFDKFSTVSFFTLTNISDFVTAIAPESSVHFDASLSLARKLFGMLFHASPTSGPVKDENASKPTINVDLQSDNHISSRKLASYPTSSTSLFSASYEQKRSKVLKEVTASLPSDTSRSKAHQEGSKQHIDENSIQDDTAKQCTAAYVSALIAALQSYTINHQWQHAIPLLHELHNLHVEFSEDQRTQVVNILDRARKIYQDNVHCSSLEELSSFLTAYENILNPQFAMASMETELWSAVKNKRANDALQILSAMKRAGLTLRQRHFSFVADIQDSPCNMLNFFLSLQAAGIELQQTEINWLARYLLAMGHIDLIFDLPQQLSEYMPSHDFLRDLYAAVLQSTPKISPSPSTSLKTTSEKEPLFSSTKVKEANGSPTSGISSDSVPLLKDEVDDVKSGHAADAIILLRRRLRQVFEMFKKCRASLSHKEIDTLGALPSKNYISLVVDVIIDAATSNPSLVQSQALLLLEKKLAFEYSPLDALKVVSFCQLQDIVIPRNIYLHLGKRLLSECSWDAFLDLQSCMEKAHVFYNINERTELRALAKTFWKDTKHITTIVEQAQSGSLSPKILCSPELANAVLQALINLGDYCAIFRVIHYLDRQLLAVDARVISALIHAAHSSRDTAMCKQGVSLAIKFGVRLPARALQMVLECHMHHSEVQDAVDYLFFGAANLPLLCRANTLKPLLTGAEQKSQEILNLIMNRALDENQGKVLNGLLDFLIDGHQLDTAAYLFTRIIQERRHLVRKREYFRVISLGLIRADSLNRVSQFLSDMAQYRFNVDKDINHALLTAYFKQGYLDKAQQLLDHLSAAGFRLTDAMLVDAVLGSLEHRDVIKAESIFARMLSEDRTDVLPVVAALMKYYVQNGDFSAAVKLSQSYSLFGKVKRRPNLEAELQSLIDKIPSSSSRSSSLFEKEIKDDQTNIPKAQEDGNEVILDDVIPISFLGGGIEITELICSVLSQIKQGDGLTACINSENKSSGKHFIGQNTGAAPPFLQVNFSTMNSYYRQSKIYSDVEAQQALDKLKELSQRGYVKSCQELYHVLLPPGNPNEKILSPNMPLPQSNVNDVEPWMCLSLAIAGHIHPLLCHLETLAKVSPCTATLCSQKVIHALISKSKIRDVFHILRVLFENGITVSPDDLTTILRATILSGNRRSYDRLLELVRRNNVIPNQEFIELVPDQH